EPGMIQSNNRAVGKVASLDATPFDCQERIRTAPDSTEFAPQEGATFCLFTSQNDAAAQGISQKVVFVRVDSVTKDSDVGVLNITVKAYVVPQ
ncbi:MAG: hypothetical protein ABW022_22430, partial [Actinoplanes sp.]